MVNFSRGCWGKLLSPSNILGSVLFSWGVKHQTMSTVHTATKTPTCKCYEGCPACTDLLSCARKHQVSFSLYTSKTLLLLLHTRMCNNLHSVCSSFDVFIDRLVSWSFLMCCMFSLSVEWLWISWTLVMCGVRWVNWLQGPRVQTVSNDLDIWMLFWRSLILSVSYFFLISRFTFVNSFNCRWSLL